METLETRVRRIAQEAIEEALAPYQLLLEELRGFVMGSSGTTARPASRAVTKKSRGRGRGPKLSCGIQGCSRPRVSKGYCLNHYIKRRGLLKTKRLPRTWIENPEPGTVEDLKLPRGRASSKTIKKK